MVDAGSTDGTMDRALETSKGRQNFKIIVDSTATNPARGRNVGAKVSTGSLLGFIDADCIAERTWLSTLVDQFGTQKVAGVGGRTVFGNVPNGRPLLQGLHGALETKLGNGGSLLFDRTMHPKRVKHLPSCNAVYLKEVFFLVGGFDGSLRYCEDVCLNQSIRRAGFYLYYTPNATVIHSYRESVSEFVSWMYNYGKGRSTIVRRRRSTLSAPMVAILATFSITITLAEVSPVSFIQIFLLSLAAYLALGALLGIISTRKIGYRSFLYAPSYLIIHLVYATGTLAGLLPRKEWRKRSDAR